MPTWKSGGYVFQSYLGDHAPRHVHVFKDGTELDKFDLENGKFMDGTVGRHKGRVLRALRDLGLIA